MALTLTITGAPAGAPPPLRLDRRGASIGRDPTADLTLPDPQQFVSSRHAEITFCDDGYVLTDRSTNGTFVNGIRLAAPHRLVAGDRIRVGGYELVATLDGSGGTAVSTSAASAPDALQRKAIATVTALREGRRKARRELGIEDKAPLATLDSPAALEAARAELEAHQRAILRAMQGAMVETMAALAPQAIRQRLPAAKPAELWSAYEEAFAGSGTSDRFAERFARALRAAYAEADREALKTPAARP